MGTMFNKLSTHPVLCHVSCAGKNTSIGSCTVAYSVYIVLLIVSAFPSIHMFCSIPNPAKCDTTHTAFNILMLFFPRMYKHVPCTRNVFHFGSCLIMFISWYKCNIHVRHRRPDKLGPCAWLVIMIIMYTVHVTLLNTLQQSCILLINLPQKAGWSLSWTD